MQYTDSKNIRISDAKFTLTSKEIMDGLVTLMPQRYWEWQTEVFDCDEFSFALQGEMRLICGNLAFGIVWTQNHALNYCFVVDAGEVKMYFVEPQLGKLYYLSPTQAQSLGIQLMII